MRCSAGAFGLDDALRVSEPLRVGEGLDGRVDLGVGVFAAGGH